ncbi:MAG TPA: glycosyltransferase family 2 protein, partial [Rhodothermales bacterium]|nr:glycosyltransferase family 2 protein [Rhodothermales bacterium]
VIPAFNEARAIARVIRDLPSDLVHTVVVVDNASTDETADVARAAGAVVVPEPRRGYGRACLAGIAHARTLAPDVLVFLDGDYSDHSDELPRLLAPIESGEADFVVGSRMRGQRERGALLPQAVVGGWLAGHLMHMLWGIRWTDLGPFRAIRFAAFERLGMQDQTYGWTVEMQIKAARTGLRCVEVPVSYRRRIGTSKITGTVAGTGKAAARILWTILRYGAADLIKLNQRR